MQNEHRDLSSKSIQSATLPLQSVDNIHSGDSLPLGMLGVGDGVADDILQEHLQNTPGLLIDQPRDSLHPTSPGQPPNSRLGDALDIVPQHLSVPLGSSLPQSLASLATACHAVTCPH